KLKGQGTPASPSIRKPVNQNNLKFLKTGPRQKLFLWPEPSLVLFFLMLPFFVFGVIKSRANVINFHKYLDHCLYFYPSSAKITVFLIKQGQIPSESFKIVGFGQ